MVKEKLHYLVLVILVLSTSNWVIAKDRSQTLVAERTKVAPIIDGNDLDPCWASPQAIITHDKVGDIDITIKALYSDKQIFMLVSFPDPDKSIKHKSWVWEKNAMLYKTGTDREDSFVFKWNMAPKPVDLSIYADNPYNADIWFWKACRTDPAGYADDKMQILSSTKTKKSLTLTDKSGTTMYLLRHADKGTTAFKTRMISEFESDIVDRFNYRQPKGSCADVKAKGIWKKGRWTIEFARKLVTGNNDDIEFDLNKKPQFGVSRFEISGGKINKKLSQPLYNCGDISEIITLVFKNEKVK
jgi:hypothetical protein